MVPVAVSDGSGIVPWDGEGEGAADRLGAEAAGRGVDVKAGVLTALWEGSDDAAEGVGGITEDDRDGAKCCGGRGCGRDLSKAADRW